MSKDTHTQNLETFQRWDVKALKAFLKKRNLPLLGNKSVLVARCFSAQELNIPVALSATEQKQRLDLEYQNLLITDDEHRLPDPFYELTDGWQNEQSSLANWPPTLIQDISVYLNKHDTVTGKVSLTKRLLSDYKEQKAYSYFQSKFIFEVLYHPIKQESSYCFMKCKCQPSQRIKDVPHDLCILLRKHTGDIVSAYCTCFAGLGQTCNHIAALLFRVDHAWKNGECQISCTSQPCTWSSSRKPIAPILVSDMNITKPAAESTVSEHTKSLNCAAKRLFNPHRPLIGMTQQTFLEKLNVFSPKSVTLAERNPTRRSVHVEYDRKFYPNTGDADLPDTIETLATKACDVGEFRHKVMSLTYTHDDVRLIEQHTRDQNGTLWALQRRGRLTASKFHRIYTRMNTYDSDSSADMSSVISDVLQYTTPSSEIKHLKYGRRLESTARKSYTKMLEKGGHHDVSVTVCGLFIDNELPYIGASPDGIVTCSCCPKRVLEIKCPTSCMHSPPVADNVECLTQADGKTALKKNHKYFTQTMGQMAVTKLCCADFFVYSDRGCHLERITYDDNLWQTILKQLQKFFVTFIVPELILRTVQKRIESTPAVTHDCDGRTSRQRKVKAKTKTTSRRATKRKQPERPVYVCDVCLNQCEDVCQFESDFSKFSIGCDACKRWFHWQCVGIDSHDDARLQSKEFVCTDCKSLGLDFCDM